MQLSNGLADPVGLWLGHLLFDSVFAVIAATLMIIVFAVASNQFHGLGLFVSSTIFLYLVRSPTICHAVACSCAVRYGRGALLVLHLACSQFAVSCLRSIRRLPSDHVCGMYIFIVNQRMCR